MNPCVPETLPIQSIVWEPLIPLIGQANRALARYDGILHGLRNPNVLLAPLTTQEAVLSSKIEGTRATLGEVLKHEAGEEPKDEEKREDIHEIINYRQALRHAEEELNTRPFTLNLLLSLHSMLLDSVRGKDKSRGRFRTSQNYIGAPGSTIAQAVYIPPEPRRLPPSLDNWEKYYHMDRPDSLVQLAIVHAQFEIIHPFLDGNGRLGRMLVPLFLFEKKILSRPMFYLSSYLEAKKDAYVGALRALNRPNNWNQWIHFFLEALHRQAEANCAKATKIIALYEKLKKDVLEITHSQFAVPLLDRFFEMPIFRSSALKPGSGLPSKPMIMTMLGQLRKAKILHLVREGRGRRSSVLALPELVNLCEGRKVI